MIVIVDYKMGNLGSIKNMVKIVGGEAVISSDPEIIYRADGLILSGVGAFDSGMKAIKELGLYELLQKKVNESKTPILGLCLGMQLFTKGSEEGCMPGFGWIDGESVKFNFDEQDNKLKIPHMGWNSLKIKQDIPIFRDIGDEPRFYFVHSYHVVCNNEQQVVAETNFGYDFVSVVTKDNIIGMQFHPEKSHKFGMKVFTNFLEMF